MNPCARCGTASASLRTLPRASEGTWVEAATCEACVGPSLDEIRAILADDDGAPFNGAVMSAILLSLYLRARGVADAAIAKDREPRQVLEGVLALLDELQQHGGQLGPRLLCSSCFATLPERQITVIPSWNDDAGDYVTTFRCASCLAPSLDEVRARLADPTRPEEVGQVCAFLERYAVFVHEHRRGDPVDVVRPLVSMVLDRLQTRDLVLPVGQTVPLGP